MDTQYDAERDFRFVNCQTHRDNDLGIPVRYNNSHYYNKSSLLLLNVLSLWQFRYRIPFECAPNAPIRLLCFLARTQPAAGDAGSVQLQRFFTEKEKLPPPKLSPRRNIGGRISLLEPDFWPH